MSKVIIGILVKNIDEWVLLQEILISLGYKWRGGGKRVIEYTGYNYILIWSNGIITADREKYGNDDYKSLEGFLDYVERNDIGYNG